MASTVYVARETEGEPRVAASPDTVKKMKSLGLDVVVDIGHHDDYSESLGMFADAARRL